MLVRTRRRRERSAGSTPVLVERSVRLIEESGSVGMDWRTFRAKRARMLEASIRLDSIVMTWSCGV